MPRHADGDKGKYTNTMTIQNDTFEGKPASCAYPAPATSPDGWQVAVGDHSLERTAMALKIAGMSSITQEHSSILAALTIKKAYP